ncbi:MAG: ApaG protein [Saprospiraceae bacterium]|jgi:ApaG protein
MNPAYQIDVSVVPQYLRIQSDPDNNQYVFAYTVTILNSGSEPAELVSRHWIITDSDGEEEQVRGPGVIGEFPYLKPGESFTYSSGSILKTPVGTMAGSYQMKSSDGTEFDADIAPFTLSSVVLN